MTVLTTKDSDGEPVGSPAKDPINQPRRTLKVVVIGAGASGLLLAYKMQRHFDDLDLKVFEKNPAVSGTWFENTYPGCACDVPAHCYTWSFEPKPDWSASLAGASEIRQYFTNFCTRHGLEKYIELEHQVLSAEWSEVMAQWQINVKDLRTNTQRKVTAHVLINAAGILNKWQWPMISGLHSFKGKLLHTAAWDDTVELSGKTVGLIGNGSSGIQILPAIKSQVQKLFHFVRQPTWIAPVFADYKKYTAEEIQLFTSNPEHHLSTRRELEHNLNAQFELFVLGSPMHEKIRSDIKSSMEKELDKHELSDHLIPSFPPGCRRLTPGIGYLESLMDEKVQTIVGSIDRISEEGVVSENGTTYPIDVLICATGFDTTYRPGFPIVGSAGQSLSEAWRDEVECYLGLAVPNYPNYFMTLGPNSPIGNGPLLIGLEHQVSYIIQVLSKFQKENIRSFDVSSAATESFSRWKDEYMKHTVWKQDCQSWYKAGSKSGRVVALWPGSTLHYLETIKSPRYEDWQWNYQKGANPWAFLGNGFSTAEKRLEGSLSWYIASHDDSPVDPCLKAARDPKDGSPGEKKCEA